MKIGKLRPNDVDQVAKLHQTYMERGFLSTLGSTFLARLYAAMLASEHAFCIVARDGAQVAGFVSGTKHVAGFYKEFILRDFFSVGLILLPKIISLPTMKKMLETLVYPSKEKGDLPDAELLSIVIDKRYRGQGVSVELFNALVDEFASQSVNRFKVVVGANLTAANRFYEKAGGEVVKQIEVHKGEMSNIYLFDIQQTID